MEKIKNKPGKLLILTLKTSSIEQSIEPKMDGKDDRRENATTVYCGR